MLPFVYNGDDDDGDSFDNERRSQKRSRSRSRSASRSRSPPRDRRYRSSRWSRSPSSEREDGEHSRSPRLRSERSSCRSSDRHSSRESGEFSSALPYLSSLQSRSSHYDKSVHSNAPYGQPHYKIVMKMLPPDLQRDTLIAQVSRQGFRVKDIRVIHKGPDRCFGFVEFLDVNSAQAWMEFNKGVFTVDDGRQIRMEYSRYDSLDGRSALSSNSGDWMCAKCTIKNFKNRGSCFKCNLTRVESEGLTRKGYAAIGVAKCDTILLREIPLKCTETAIQAQLTLLTSLEPLRVHIAESGLYAYVQMRSADEAERVMLFFNQIPLHIDGCAVMVTYSRLPLNTVLSTSLAAESIQKATDRVNQLPAFKPTAGTGNSGVEAAQLAIAKAALIRQMTESIISGDAYAAPPPTMVPAHQPLDPNFVITDYFKEEQPSVNFVCVEDVAPQSSAQEFAMPNKTSSGCLPSSLAVASAPGATDLGVVKTPWGVFRKYATPNPTLYQYEASSGLYYDPTTGLYYDSNSQYYWDSNVQKWNSWNASFQAYIPCDLLSSDKNLPAQAKDSVSNANEPIVKEGTEELTEKKSPPSADSDKKPEKSAKDIAREMARWAKKQSKVLLAVKATPKLELTSPLTTVSSKPKASEESTADITYKMLEKTRNPLGTASDDEEEEEAPPPPKIAATGISRLPLNVTRPVSRPSNDVSEAVIPPPLVAPSNPTSAAAVHNEEKYVDAEKKFCILCKRKFGSLEVLMKHVRLSDMHKKNLEALSVQNDRASTSSPPAFSEIPSTSDRPRQYRDRAKERRTMFGLDPSGFTIEGGDADPTDYAVRSQDIPLDETNVGNKLLKSMGWTEGMGIGKNNQGIVTPIATERRVEGAGLGAAGSRVLHSANASRRERARFATITRYQELS